jgi:hypothetical protein
LAIAQAWSDDDLLALEKRVQTYFQQPPPEPDWQAGEQLQTIWQQLDQQTQAQAQVFLQRQQELERLGVRRSPRQTVPLRGWSDVCVLLVRNYRPLFC